MKTITKEITNEIVINKSKFITVICPVISFAEIDQKIKELMTKYENATHYCYAYVIDGKEKCVDDGEPSGTAGLPILNILKTNKLTNVLCVVIRYFGGIKLGAGGLVRAYANSAKEALNKCSFGLLVDGYEVTIEFDYDNIKNIDYILRNIDVEKNFEKKIIYKFRLDADAFNNIKDSLGKFSTIIFKEKTTIIKDDC